MKEDMIMKRHVLICSLLIGANVINVNALDEEEAVQKAEQYVPVGFEYKEAEQEDGKWEIEFLSEDAEFEVTLDENGKLLKTEYEAFDRIVSKDFVLKEAEIRSILKKQFNSPEKIRITKKRSRKEGSYYKVRFRSDEYTGEAELNGTDGTFLEYELKYTKQN